MTEGRAQVGHCCESGDLLSCVAGHPDTLGPRPFSEQPLIGDVLVLGGAGAYCSSMSTKNYNSFPEAAEVLIDRGGRAHLIRRRQPLQQIFQNEVPYLVPSSSSGEEGAEEVNS
jgi:diaminopimelate decarboxylase